MKQRVRRRTIEIGARRGGHEQRGHRESRNHKSGVKEWASAGTSLAVNLVSLLRRYRSQNRYEPPVDPL